MAESVYKVIQLVGTSEESWEKAAAAAVSKASSSLRDLRVAEVAELDVRHRRPGRRVGLPHQAERLVQVRGLRPLSSSRPAGRAPRPRARAAGRSGARPPRRGGRRARRCGR